MVFTNDDILEISTKTSLYSIKWKLIDICNYKCEYCYQKRSEKDISEYVKYNKQKIYETLEKINNIIEKLNRPIEIHFTGGEVTLIDLYDIIQKLHSNTKKIVIATNFSNTSDYYNSIIDYCKTKSIKLTILASYHSSQCSFNDFFTKLTKLNDKKCVKSIFVFNKANFNKMYSKARFLTNLGYLVKPVPMRDSSLDKATETQIELMNYFRNKSIKKPFYVKLKNATVYANASSEIFSYIDNHVFSPKDFYCTNYLAYIDVNGNFSYNNCNIKDLVYDINEPIKTILCKRDKCSLCNSCIISKTKPEVL